jgi:hypothetical protein
MAGMEDMFHQNRPDLKDLGALENFGNKYRAPAWNLRIKHIEGANGSETYHT